MPLAQIVKSLLRYLPAPLLVGAAGLALLLLLSRLDGAQSARLTELDRQQAKTTQQALAAAQSYRATKARSEATDRENARLRAAVAAKEASIARLRTRADSLTGSLQPVLAGLPDSVAFHVKQVLTLKDSVIAQQEGVIHDLSTIVDSLQADRDRWRDEAGLQRNLALTWRDQSEGWEKQAKRGCLPLVGCVSRSAIALVAGGLGLAGGLLAR